MKSTVICVGESLYSHTPRVGSPCTCWPDCTEPERSRASITANGKWRRRGKKRGECGRVEAFGRRRGEVGAAGVCGSHSLWGRLAHWRRPNMNQTATVSHQVQVHSTKTIKVFTVCACVRGRVRVCVTELLLVLRRVLSEHLGVVPQPLGSDPELENPPRPRTGSVWMTSIHVWTGWTRTLVQCSQIFTSRLCSHY